MPFTTLEIKIYIIITETVLGSTLGTLRTNAWKAGQLLERQAVKLEVGKSKSYTEF